MARVLLLVAAACMFSASAGAEEAPEDPRKAIEQRGITVPAGKRHYFVIVPPASQPSSVPVGAVLNRSVIYFGDGKKLYRQGAMSWAIAAGTEELSIDDGRRVYSATLTRTTNDAYSLRCWLDGRTDKKERRIALGTATRTGALPKAIAIEPQPGFDAYLLAREMAGTTYYLLDRPRSADPESKDFRFFIGKRGALKRIPIKEMAFDSKSDIFVTASGTLVIERPQRKDEEPRVSFGTAQQTELTHLPLWPNRHLIYLNLGVYTREPTGYPCDEL